METGVAEIPYGDYDLHWSWIYISDSHRTVVLGLSLCRQISTVRIRRLVDETCFPRRYGGLHSTASNFNVGISTRRLDTLSFRCGASSLPGREQVYTVFHSWTARTENWGHRGQEQSWRSRTPYHSASNSVVRGWGHRQSLSTSRSHYPWIGHYRIHCLYLRHIFLLAAQTNGFWPRSRYKTRKGHPARDIDWCWSTSTTALQKDTLRLRWNGTVVMGHILGILAGYSDEVSGHQLSLEEATHEEDTGRLLPLTHQKQHGDPLLLPNRLRLCTYRRMELPLSNRDREANVAYHNFGNHSRHAGVLDYTLLYIRDSSSAPGTTRGASGWEPLQQLWYEEAQIRVSEPNAIRPRKTEE